MLDSVVWRQREIDTRLSDIREAMIDFEKHLNEAEVRVVRFDGERRNLTQHPHYAFEVKSLKDSSQRLDEHKIPYEWNTFSGPGVGIYFSDPDGNHLEYIESRGHSKEGIKIGDPDWGNLQYDFNPETANGSKVTL